VTGIERGFLGLMRRRVRPLMAHDVDDILDQGGTILGTHNRADPFHDLGHDGADVSDGVLAFVREIALDGVLAIGGDGTMTIAHRLHGLGLPMVGVPKTIDNDLACTERTFGFDSAVAVVAEAIGRLRTTARAHGRVMIVETMGRNAGWIALEGGLAGGADVILIPELPFDPQVVLQRCRERENAGDSGFADGSTIVCLAEGAAALGEPPTYEQRVAGRADPVRLGGVGEKLRAMLEPHLRSEVRTTLLGHVQRGGTPTAFDRVLATRLGHAAARMALQGRFGQMAALQCDDCVGVSLDLVAGRTRRVPVDHALVGAARSLGVCLGDR
jgi:6-phosphofructokinase 1